VVGDRAVSIAETGGPDIHFTVGTKAGKSFDTKYVFLASGAHRRRLKVPGEDKFEGKGVVYCSICDAPLFKDKTVAVVGGGNAALEAVIDLLPYAPKIYMLVRGAEFRGDAVTQEKVRTHENVKVMFQAEIKEILGDDLVTGVKYLDKAAGEEKELALEGVFVEIGSVPNSDFVKDLVDLNERGEVIVDHKTQQSSHPGIWAAGDVSDVRYKQNNISAGDAVKAVLHIYETMTKTAHPKEPSR
jgi:alkyl hydroperoxide reductase subunit F